MALPTVFKYTNVTIYDSNFCIEGDFVVDSLSIISSTIDGLNLTKDSRIDSLNFKDSVFTAYCPIVCLFNIKKLVMSDFASITVINAVNIEKISIIRVSNIIHFKQLTNVREIKIINSTIHQLTGIPSDLLVFDNVKSRSNFLIEGYDAELRSFVIKDSILGWFFIEDSRVHQIEFIRTDFSKLFITSLDEIVLRDSVFPSNFLEFKIDVIKRLKISNCEIFSIFYFPSYEILFLDSITVINSIFHEMELKDHYILPRAKESNLWNTTFNQVTHSLDPYNEFDDRITEQYLSDVKMTVSFFPLYPVSVLIIEDTTFKDVVLKDLKRVVAKNVNFIDCALDTLYIQEMNNVFFGRTNLHTVWLEKCPQNTIFDSVIFKTPMVVYNVAFEECKFKNVSIHDSECGEDAVLSFLKPLNGAVVLRIINSHFYDNFFSHFMFDERTSNLQSTIAFVNSNIRSSFSVSMFTLGKNLAISITNSTIATRHLLNIINVGTRSVAAVLENSTLRSNQFLTCKNAKFTITQIIGTVSFGTYDSGVPQTAIIVGEALLLSSVSGNIEMLDDVLFFDGPRIEVYGIDEGGKYSFNATGVNCVIGREFVSDIFLECRNLDWTYDSSTLKEGQLSCFGSYLCPDEFKIEEPVHITYINSFNDFPVAKHGAVDEWRGYGVLNRPIEGKTFTFDTVIFDSNDVSVQSLTAVVAKDGNFTFTFTLKTRNCGDSHELNFQMPFYLSKSTQGTEFTLFQQGCQPGWHNNEGKCELCPVGTHQPFWNSSVTMCNKDHRIVAAQKYWKVRVSGQQLIIPNRTFVIETNETVYVFPISNEFTNPGNLQAGLSGRTEAECSADEVAYYKYFSTNIDDHNGCVDMHHGTGCMRCVSSFNGYVVIKNSFTRGCTCLMKWYQLVIVFAAQIIIIMMCIAIYNKGYKFPWTKFLSSGERYLDYDIFECIRLLKDFMLVVLPAVLVLQKDLVFEAHDSLLDVFAKSITFPFLILGYISGFFENPILNEFLNHIAITVICVIPAVYGAIRAKTTGIAIHLRSGLEFSSSFIAVFCPFLLKDLIVLVIPHTYTDLIMGSPIPYLVGKSPFDLDVVFSSFDRWMSVIILIVLLSILFAIFHKGIIRRPGIKTEYKYSLYIVLLNTSFSLFSPDYLILGFIFNLMFVFLMKPFKLHILNDITSLILFFILVNICVSRLLLGWNAWVALVVLGLFALLFITTMTLKNDETDDNTLLIENF
ncbi:hypothetical protein PCE1_003744 [Barthelona sp. PCE]